MITGRPPQPGLFFCGVRETDGGGPAQCCPPQARRATSAFFCFYFCFFCFYFFFLFFLVLFLADLAQSAHCCFSLVGSVTSLPMAFILGYWPCSMKKVNDFHQMKYFPLPSLHEPARSSAHQTTNLRISNPYLSQQKIHSRADLFPSKHYILRFSTDN